MPQIAVGFVFQRDPEWFLDESADLELPAPAGPTGDAAKVPLEPAFLFSKDVQGRSASGLSHASINCCGTLITADS